MAGGHIVGAAFTEDTAVYYLNIEAFEGKQTSKHAVIYRGTIYYVSTTMVLF